MYREALLPAAPVPGPGAAPAGDLAYALPRSEQAAGAAAAEGSLHGRRLLEPYPTLEPLQVGALGGVPPPCCVDNQPPTHQAPCCPGLQGGPASARPPGGAPPPFPPGVSGLRAADSRAGLPAPLNAPACPPPPKRAPSHLLPPPCAPPPPPQIKRLAARRHNTTYCYDFPTVFENALRDVWCACGAGGRGWCGAGCVGNQAHAAAAPCVWALAWPARPAGHPPTHPPARPPIRPPRRALRAAQGEPNSVPPAGRLVEAIELKLPANVEQVRRAGVQGGGRGAGAGTDPRACLSTRSGDPCACAHRLATTDRRHRPSCSPPASAGSQAAWPLHHVTHS